MDTWILSAYGAWNLFVAIYYAWDKRIAIQNAGHRRTAARLGRRSTLEHWRISESRLLWLAAGFGAGGALVSMLIFRHKVRKWPFFVLVPVFLVGHVLLLWWLGLI